MSLRFCDGFDHYATAQVGQKWTPTNGTNLPPIIQGGGRESGGGALEMTSNWDVSRTMTSESQWTVGFALNMDGNGARGAMLTIYDSVSGQELLQAWVNSNGSVSAQVASGTYTSTATGLIPASAWAYVEAQIVISATVGSVEVRVNETTVISETGLNTAWSGHTTADTVAIGNAINGGAQNGLYDDLYVTDGNGTANTGFLGNIIVQAIWPNAPGASSQWTPSPYANNFANVNDETPDGDATTNQSGTVGQIDTFAHDEIRPASGTILGIQHVIAARTTTSTTHSVAAVEESGGTNYADTGQSLQTGYEMLTFPHDTDPATGAAFTIADLNAADFGYELTA